MSGSLLLILHSHLPYVIRHGRWPHGAEWLCEAAAECYLPLLNEWHDLRGEGIVPNVTISISPVLLEQLADEEFADLLDDYLRERAASAADDAKQFALSETDRHLAPIATFWHDWYRDRRDDFTRRYDRDIVGAFRDLRDAGAIAIQTCGATHGYLPLLGRDESIHAQVQVAVDTHWRHFRHRPRGIWMPECAYRPGGWWDPPMPTHDAESRERLGVEAFIAAGGIDHTVVDAHTVRAGAPVDWYRAMFMGGGGSGGTRVPLGDPRSVHEPYRIHPTIGSNIPAVSAFPRDVDLALQVWSSNSGYPGNPPYLEFHKKHHRSGHRYWSVTGRDVDLAAKGPYDPAAAEERIAHDAATFAHAIVDQLRAYNEATGRDGMVCLPFDTELFGHWWFEGPRFIGAVIRRIAATDGLEMSTAAQELDRHGPGLPVTLPESSWGDGGDHRVWMNEETSWTWRIIWSAEREFLELLESRDRNDPLQERGLRQMARELLLLQSSDWQFLITTGTAIDYAEERFRDHHAAFEAIGGYVRSLRSGAEDLWLFDKLCTYESRDRLFPSLDLDHWSWKNAEEALAAPLEGSS